MDDDRASEGSNGRGVKVDWDVVVLLGGHGKGNIELTEEVERELGLGKELVPQEFW